MKTNTYLKIDHFEIDPAVESLLPFDIAERYHALPIATDGEHVTIAIAEPTDVTATSVVSAFIGQPAYFVKAEHWQIDNRLNELRAKGIHPEYRFISCRSTENNPTLPQQRFFDNIINQFGAAQGHLDVHWDGWRSIRELAREAYQLNPDLVVLQIEELLSSQRELNKAISHNLFQQMPCSILVPLYPAWPIDNILLVIPDGDEVNDAAIDWAIHFASFPTARVSVLPIMPPSPGMYGSLFAYDIASLIDSKDPLGKKVRFALDRLQQAGLRTSFRLRTGEPLDQLRQEILSLKPDLIVAAGRPSRPFLGSLAKPLVNWAQCPVLFAACPQ